jgi:hypothetical protein
MVIYPKAYKKYYVVTARRADRKERAIYHTEIQEGGEQVA